MTASNDTTSQNLTTTLVTAALTASSNGRIYGWVNQPNSRGTMDILWACLFTIFICTYVMLCLNVPATSEGMWRFIGRKLFWMGIALIGPEFVLTVASGQWNAARESVILFHESGYKQWTIRHGFFADMGGFLLVPSDGTPPFPIASKHLHWLVTHNYLEFPEVTKEEMEDKSKQDKFAKFITLFQAGYLVLQCIGRAAQRLAVTTLELFSLAIVVCSFLTAWCWLHKPLDVGTPIKLPLRTSIEEILQAASGEGAVVDDWQQTPLDFIEDFRPSWNLNVQAFMHLKIPTTRPISRIGNDSFPDLNGYQGYLCVATLGYAAIHLAGWNLTFPSKIELILWRVSSMFLFGTTAVFWIFEKAAAWHRNGRWQRMFFRVFKPKRAGVAMMDKAVAEREGKRLRKDLPLPFEFWSILPLAILYGVARLYLIVEVFLGLRELELSAYLNVDWSEYLPHV
ncbi:hypothetical protein FN846DRAFT_959244 [Sphaerosporella brunnea]|uniref:Uncharacterized protein n=1 Tax=Sphaerosporella brunnea TaxID=1250544 RepID=A0A5J5EQB3_9PEZI|nr:hypothetical protein FN846DRAFT_959244 [Sphaerosporella brunnea]